MVSVEFSDGREAEALLRGAVLFKFEGGEAADLYVGSPQYANALRALLAAVIREARAKGDDARAGKWLELYRLAGHPAHWDATVDYCARHPQWATINAEQRTAWMETVAAPYRLGGDRETLEQDIDVKAAEEKSGTGG